MLISFEANFSHAGVVNLVLLKCRKPRREDQEKSDRQQDSFYWEHKLLVAAVIEVSILSNFTRLFYRHFWRRDFSEVETTSNKASTWGRR